MHNIFYPNDNTYMTDVFIIHIYTQHKHKHISFAILWYDYVLEYKIHIGKDYDHWVYWRRPKLGIWDMISLSLWSIVGLVRYQIVAGCGQKLYFSFLLQLSFSSQDILKYFIRLLSWKDLIIHFRLVKLALMSRTWAIRKDCEQ